MRPVRIWSGCLAWGFALIAGLAVGSPPVLAEESRPADPVSEQPDVGPVEVRDAVNRELFDLARALRSLDQSYAFRGIQGGGAWTAGSAHIDWHAQGLCSPPAGTRVLPPPPLVLGGCRSICRSVDGARCCGEHSPAAAIGEDGCATLTRRICTGCGHVYPRDELPRCRCHGGEVIGPLQSKPFSEPREPTPVETVPAAPVLPVP